MHFLHLKNNSLKLYFSKVILSVSMLSMLAACATTQISKEAQEDIQVISNYTPRDDGLPLSPAELQAFNTTGELDKNLSQEEKHIVELHFKFFVHKNRGTFERFLTRSARFLPYAQKVFRERGLPEEMAYLFMIESGGNPKAVSPAGAGGLWQFMPYTGKKYGLVQNAWLDERRDPFKATFAASDYLLKLYGDFKNWHLAAAAYNAGEGKIGRALDASNSLDFFELCRKDHMIDVAMRLKEETRQYVPRLIAVAKIMRNLELLGFRSPTSSEAYDLVPLSVPPKTNLKELAKVSGMSWEEFTDANPAFKRQVSPPTTMSIAYVLPVHFATAQVWLDSGKGRARNIEGKEYTVQRKDTLASIAKKFKISVAALKNANSIDRTPKYGTILFIPVSAPIAQQSNTTKTVAPTSQVNSAAVQGSYIVQSGDSLFSLAKKWGTSVEKIKTQNKLSSTHLRLGQKLEIPENPQLAAKTNKLSSVKTVQPSASKKETKQVAKKAQPTKENVQIKEKTKVTTSQVNKTVVSLPSSSGTSTKTISHTVKKSESLFSIAKKYNASVQKIKAQNKLSSDKLKIGQVLQIPKN